MNEEHEALAGEGDVPRRISSAEFAFWTLSVQRASGLLLLTYIGLPVVVVASHFLADASGVPLWMYLFTLLKVALSVWCTLDFQSRLKTLVPSLTDTPWGMEPTDVDVQQESLSQQESQQQEKQVWDEALNKVYAWRVVLCKPSTWFNVVDYHYVLWLFILSEVADQDTDAMQPGQIAAVMTSDSAEKFQASWPGPVSFIGWIGLPNTLLIVLGYAFCEQLSHLRYRIPYVLRYRDDHVRDQVSASAFYTKIGYILNYAGLPLPTAVAKRLAEAKGELTAKPGGSGKVLCEAMPQLWFGFSGFCLNYDQLTSMGVCQLAVGLGLSYLQAVLFIKELLLEYYTSFVRGKLFSFEEQCIRQPEVATFRRTYGDSVGRCCFWFRIFGIKLPLGVLLPVFIIAMPIRALGFFICPSHVLNIIFEPGCK